MKRKRKSHTKIKRIECNISNQMSANPFSISNPFYEKYIDNSVIYLCYYCHTENKMDIGNKIECLKCQKNIFVKKRMKKSMFLLNSTLSC
jgi:DNA-directed RNA polymerase subunit RPC12/RpoP